MEPGTGNKEPGTARGFRKLVAWQKADELAAAVFKLTRLIPASDRWLGIQLLRAAVSVPANIAEGYGRGALGDYLRFLEIANGSLNEVEYYLHFLGHNDILPAEQLTTAGKLQHETGALLSGLSRSLRVKLGEAGGWRRGLVREDQAEYVAGDD